MRVCLPEPHLASPLLGLPLDHRQTVHPGGQISAGSRLPPL